MDEKTATYVQYASIGLGCALSVLGFAYACWSHQKKNYYHRLNNKIYYLYHPSDLKIRKMMKEKLTPNLLKLFVQD